MMSSKLLGKIGTILVPVVITMAFCGIMVLAADPPSDTPTISNVKVNTYLLKTGDVLIYGDYDIPYDNPGEQPPADSTYILRLMDGDEEIGMITPYVYFDNGYNLGVFAFYLESGIVWETPYIIRISQNPAVFPSPESWDYVMQASAYTSATTHGDNQTELALNIILAAQRLEVAYPAYTLLEPSAGGTVLSNPAGENYFRGAIYGIQAMAPDLFLVQLVASDNEAREWTTDQFDEYAERFSTMWVGEETEATAEQFGLTTPGIMSLVFVLPICLGAIVVTSIKFRKVEPGLVFSILTMTCAVLMGWFPGAMYAIILQFMAIYIAYLWFYSRG